MTKITAISLAALALGAVTPVYAKTVALPVTINCSAAIGGGAVCQAPNKVAELVGTAPTVGSYAFNTAVAPSILQDTLTVSYINTAGQRAVLNTNYIANYFVDVKATVAANPNWQPITLGPAGYECNSGAAGCAVVIVKK